MKNWYVAKNSNDTQGLVIDEITGENIAVIYKKEDAPLIASAPELLEALKEALNYIKCDYIDADGIEDRLGNVIKKAEGKKNDK